MNDVEFASYADDNTPLVVGDDLKDDILKFQNAVFFWLRNNNLQNQTDFVIPQVKKSKLWLGKHRCFRTKNMEKASKRFEK